MAELKPLGEIPKKEPEKNQEVKKEAEKQPEKVEISNDLLKKVNGELCFELEFGSKKLVISESKCNQLIPAFKQMLPEQKETFLMQAAIFGANPFSVPAEIYPVPFKNKDNSTTYAPVINYKKYIDFGAANPRFNGTKSGVVVETADGNIINRAGQVYGSKETLIGGWCEVYLKGIKEPVFRSVNIKEFEQSDNNGVLTKFWKQDGKRALMIEKVACKLAFEIAMKIPKTYIEEELPAIDIDHEDVSDQKAIGANNEEFFNKK
jgi:hypothetical protein